MNYLDGERRRAYIKIAAYRLSQPEEEDPAHHAYAWVSRCCTRHREPGAAFWTPLMGEAHLQLTCPAALAEIPMPPVQRHASLPPFLTFSRVVAAVGESARNFTSAPLTLSLHVKVNAQAAETPININKATASGEGHGVPCTSQAARGQGSIRCAGRSAREDAGGLTTARAGGWCRTRAATRRRRA